jgi:hypothetical protein
MPENKDLKRLVRARMQKTGEAYTAARAHIINKKPRARVRARAAVVPIPDSVVKPLPNEPGPKEYAALAGMSDAAVKKGTGCTWEKWVYALDRKGCDEMSHSEIAKVVSVKYKAPSWWAQMVTVGYERIKGLRARGQQRSGTYGMTKSRTYNVPIGALFDAWADDAVRRRWLTGAAVKVRTATKPKSMRLDFNDTGIVAVGFAAKGAAKSSVALEHTKVPDRETVARLKAWWAERLEALGKELG